MSNENKKVAVHYRGTLDDGTEFDSSFSRNEPLTFTCMAGQMIPGFDLAVKDMEIGEVKNVRLAPSEAYGEHDDNAMLHLELAKIPAAEDLTPGSRVWLNGPGGMPMQALFVGIEDGIVTFDLNHEMAGKYLNFEITLLSAE